jgi:hypothetical protein
MPLWESPIYRFRVPVDNNDPAELKEVVFDVTASAPTFREPSENFKTALTDILNLDNHYGIGSIIEFGAAKLKNIPYLLSLGKAVCAVEFETLMNNAFSQENLAACRQFGELFQELVFPNPFLADEKRFDLAILANVLPVMPIPAERLYVLKALYEKLRTGKYLLWIAQKEGSYKAIREAGRNDFGDGIWMGKGHRYRTFYRYHPPVEVDEIMALFGFELLKKYSLGDDVRFYKKTEHIILNDILTPDLLGRYYSTDNTIEDPTSATPRITTDRHSQIVLPNPRDLALENLYIRKLRAIPPGIENAEVYHRLTAYAIARIFKGSLKEMKLKVPIARGVKEIDTVFANCATQGFFHNLQQQISSPYPMFEMKNYSHDPENDQFDQLNGRFNDQRGHFGVLVCRRAEREAAIDRCKTFLNNNYVIYLTDSDLVELLQFRRDNDEDSINELMDTRLRAVLF